jgi:hypothetical protein
MDEFLRSILDFVQSQAFNKWMRKCRPVSSPPESPSKPLDTTVAELMQSHLKNSDESKKLAALAKAVEAARQEGPNQSPQPTPPNGG